MAGRSILSKRFTSLVQLRPVSKSRWVSTADSEQAEKTDENNEKLYDHHIPTSMLQKLILAGGSALVGLADP